jgi:hypothetical protein
MYIGTITMTRVRPVLSLYGSPVPSQPYLPPPHAVCNYLHIRYKARYIVYVYIIYMYKYNFSVCHVFLPSVTLPPCPPPNSKSCEVWSFPPPYKLRDEEMIAVLHGYKQLYSVYRVYLLPTYRNRR